MAQTCCVQTAIKPIRMVDHYNGRPLLYLFESVTSWSLHREGQVRVTIFKSILGKSNNEKHVNYLLSKKKSKQKR